PLYLIGGAEILSGLRGSQQQSQPAPGSAKTESPSDQMGEFVSAVLGSTEVQWKEIFARAGRIYEAPTLLMFSGATSSACGFAQSAMGPFYCPIDRKVYLDTAFFQDLERRFRGCDVGSKSCQFSQAYVITHEIGHHVQNLLGILPQVQQAQNLCRHRLIHFWNCTALISAWLWFRDCEPDSLVLVAGGCADRRGEQPELQRA